MLLEVTPLVANAVGVLEPAEEAYLLENVLPLLEALLSAVGHLLDGDHLRGDIVAGVVDGPEGAVPDLPEVVKELVGVLGLKQQGHVGILQAPGPTHGAKTDVLGVAKIDSFSTQAAMEDWYFRYSLPI